MVYLKGKLINPVIRMTLSLPAVLLPSCFPPPPHPYIPSTEILQTRNVASFQVGLIAQESAALVSQRSWVRTPFRP